MLRMQHVIDAVNNIVNNSSAEILAIETGTIRSYHEQHYSTLHIGNALKNRGKLYSIDFDENSIKISKDVCKELSNIEWIKSDSHDALRKFLKENYKFDFALLDSKNDRDFIFEEFKLVLPMMKIGSILMVDDSGITPDGKSVDNFDQQKGEKVWEFLIQNNYPFEIKTIVPGMTQILIIVNSELINLMI